MRLAAGELDRIIKIEKRRDVVNEVGQSAPTWSTFAASVPASYSPARGREYFEAKGMVVVKPARFGIRYKQGVVEQMRVWFRGELYDIGFVEDVGRNDAMFLYCATGLTEG